MTNNLLRIVLKTATFLLCIAVLIVGAVRVRQRVFKWRVEHLYSEMQALTLHQSSWADAQSMMTRWGKWGGYKGQCTASDCRYEIALQSSPWDLVSEHFLGWHVAFYPARLRLGGRSGSFHAAFLVQDGKIVRKGLYLHVDIPPTPSAEEGDYGYSLLASSYSVGRILSSREISNNAFPGNGDFTVGRPDGCEICMAAWLKYDDHGDPAEVRKLSSMRLDCLDNASSCLTVEDILPASEPFHLYDGTSGARPPPAGYVPWHERPAQSCKAPLQALGRDATWIVAVDVLRLETVQSPQGLHERAAIQISDVLKAGSGLMPGTRFMVDPFDAGQDRTPLLSEHLTVHRPALLLYYALWLPGKDPVRTIDLDFCGVLPDKPETRSALMKGANRNDVLRQPELGASLFW